MIARAIIQFLKLESAGGILLFGAAVLAMGMANSFLAPFYNALLDTLAEIRIGDFQISKPVLLWVNDGLMAVFFLLIGLEVKSEILDGHLSTPSQFLLPLLAAAGGMLVPALVYVVWVEGNPVALQGWAIPTATDIAFSLGILKLFGSRVPRALKVFLLGLAIIDDLGAIVIIAIFYSGNLSPIILLLALAVFGVMVLLNYREVSSVPAYLLAGLVLWVLVLKSGVHATMAGVLVAFTIPFRTKQKKNFSPLKHLENALHSWVTYGIMPVFAFANAGLSLENIQLDDLLSPVPMGIVLGLVLGKPLGIFGFTWLGVITGWVRLPRRVTWRQVLGMAVTCGVGFTMSLFIGSLAFQQGGPDYGSEVKLGVLTGSLISALLGGLILKGAFLKKSRT